MKTVTSLFLVSHIDSDFQSRYRPQRDIIRVVVTNVGSEELGDIKEVHTERRQCGFWERRPPGERFLHGDDGGEMTCEERVTSKDNSKWCQFSSIILKSLTSHLSI